MSWWKNARVTAEVVVTATLPAPVQHAAAQGLHLEPTMNPAEYRQEMTREQESDAAHWHQLQNERELNRSTERPERPGSGTPARGRAPQSHAVAARNGAREARSSASRERRR